MIKKILYMFVSTAIFILLIFGTANTIMLPISEVRSADLLIPMLALLGLANSLKD
jgi:hypothetical protein